MITEEQIAFRKGKLGGSDVGAALGLNPWKSPLQLYREIRGEADGFVDSMAARVGNHMESQIASEVEIKKGWPVGALVEYADTLVHPQYPWMICHPDYYYNDVRINNNKHLVEIKNVGHRVSHHWGAEGDEHGVPPYVVAQCAVQAMLHFKYHSKEGIQPVDVAAYFGGNDLRIYELNFSEQNLDDVLKKLIEFWAYVESGELPPLQAKDNETMAKLFPQSNQNPLEVEKYILKDCEDLRYAKDKLASVKENIDFIEAKIKLELGEHDSLTLKGKVLATWKNTKFSTKVDILKSYEKLCDLYLTHTGMDAYCLAITKETGGFRRFLLKI